MNKTLLLSFFVAMILLACTDKKSEIVDAQIEIKAEKETLNKRLEALSNEGDEIIKEGSHKRETVDFDSSLILINIDREKIGKIEQEIATTNDRLHTLQKQYDSLEMELKRY